MDDRSLSMRDSRGEDCAACTIVSPNYLPYARTLAKSYLHHHPGQSFFVLIVARSLKSESFSNEPFSAALLEDLNLPDLLGTAMKYDILELNTNVKPTFLKYLLKRHSLRKLIYLDPDIYVYQSLQPIFTYLDNCTAVLTPHLTGPINDHKIPSEQDILYNGVFNLGFIAVGSNEESSRLLDWWESRCLSNGFSEGRTGLFVDQKWMNLAPGLFNDVAICRDPGYNMAFFNMHDRVLTSTDGVTVVNRRYPLRFFHFSGIVIDDDTSLSKNTDRFRLQDRPDVQPIFAAYKQSVREARQPMLDAMAYGFDRFSDGTMVTRLARRLYAMEQQHFLGGDPFDAGSRFFAFAKRKRLIGGKVKAAGVTWRDFNPKDRRVAAIHRILKIALALLGPDRYEVLMRYLSHISVLRHQDVFLRD